MTKHDINLPVFNRFSNEAAPAEKSGNSNRYPIQTSLAAIPIFLAALMVILIAGPLLALVLRTLTLLNIDALSSLSAVYPALLLSFLTTSISILLIVFLGTPLAYILARSEFRFKRLLTVVIEAPIVMPPVVAGLALLALFGRRGWFGPALEELGIVIPFTTAAVVLAQVFVAAPFYIRFAQVRFSSLAPEIREAAVIDGADQWQLFQHIYVPLSLNAMLSGLILSWARALGEFGATILFAGSLPGRTQTLPLLVYSALERDLNAAYITGVILLIVALSAFGLTRWLAQLDKPKHG